MNNIAIIGAGRLGTSLGFSLSKIGFAITGISCQTQKSAEESQKIIGDGMASTDHSLTAKLGNILFITVPDDAIEKVALNLARSDVSWKKKHVFHCSGLLSSEVLSPLKNKGAKTASIHPIQSFHQKTPNPEAFKGIYFGCEGEESALSLAKNIINKLGSYFLVVPKKEKPSYHAACSMASNFFVVLLDIAASLLENIGLEKKMAFQTLVPLVEGTWRNVKGSSPSASLTGPIVRGDNKSVSLHLNALRKTASYHEIYRTLAREALEIAKREQKIPAEKIAAIEVLLGEK